MAAIGRFRVKDDRYEGTISTLSTAKNIKFVPNPTKKKEVRPDYFAKTKSFILSSARMAKARGDEERSYLEIFLDDLGSSASVWTALFDIDGKSDLVCPRSKVNRS